MMRYSVQPREQIFVKSYGFSFFAKNMSKNNGKSKITFFEIFHSQKHFIMTHPNFRESPIRPLNYHPLIL